MRLADLLYANQGGANFSEISVTLSPGSTEHPPSLRRPQKPHIPTAQDGWQQGASKAQRAKALADLAVIHQRMTRQKGKPEMARTAQYNIWPMISI